MMAWLVRKLFFFLFFLSFFFFFFFGGVFLSFGLKFSTTSFFWSLPTLVMNMAMAMDIALCYRVISNLLGLGLLPW